MDNITFQVLWGSLLGIAATFLAVYVMLKVINYLSIEKKEEGVENRTPEALLVKQNSSDCGLGWVAVFGRGAPLRATLSSHQLLKCRLSASGICYVNWSFCMKKSLFLLLFWMPLIVLASSHCPDTVAPKPDYLTVGYGRNISSRISSHYPTRSLAELASIVAILKV